jgi:hypothetical protein
MRVCPKPRPSPGGLGKQCSALRLARFGRIIESGGTATAFAHRMTRNHWACSSVDRRTGVRAPLRILFERRKRRNVPIYCGCASPPSESGLAAAQVPILCDMDDADEAELGRLCGHLEQIERTFPLSDLQREALRKAGFALHHVFIDDLRRTLEDQYSTPARPLNEQERSHLRSLGIDPDAD